MRRRPAARPLSRPSSSSADSATGYRVLVTSTLLLLLLALLVTLLLLLHHVAASCCGCRSCSSCAGATWRISSSRPPSRIQSSSSSPSDHHEGDQYRHLGRALHGRAALGDTISRTCMCGLVGKYRPLLDGRCFSSSCLDLGLPLLLGGQRLEDAADGSDLLEEAELVAGSRRAPPA